MHVKKRIVEIERALNPKPLFTQPIAIKAHKGNLKETP
jgi:hypothetical protein